MSTKISSFSVNNDANALKTKLDLMNLKWMKKSNFR